MHWGQHGSGKRRTVSIGRAVFGNVWVRVGNGDRTSYKDKDYSVAVNSSSSRHKTIERETKMMTTATTQT